MPEPAAAPPGETVTIVLPDEAAGTRLDRVLARLLPDRSRVAIRRLFDCGAVEISPGGAESFAAARPAESARAGAVVRIAFPLAEALSAAPEDIPLSVVFEDDCIIVIDKPAGMVVHPSAGHRAGTLVNALLHHYGPSLSAIGGVLRPGIVHRLDRDTTGLLVAAKTDAAHSALMRQFMDRTVGKTYLAVTEGRPRPAFGRIEARIGRSRSRRGLHAVLPSGGRLSVTEYRTLEDYGAVALVECRLLTGRTHQARVHLAHLGSPVLCDREYGHGGVFGSAEVAAAFARLGAGVPPGFSPRLARCGLHAAGLAFRHPASGREMAFSSPIPADMFSVLEPFRAARAASR